MNLKPSYYNIEIQQLENEDMLFYNSASNSLIVLEKNYAGILEQGVSGSFSDSRTPEEIVTTLKDNGFLIPEDIAEQGRSEIQSMLSRYSISGFGMVIAPTLDCNMACPYCFENKRNRPSMTDATAEKLLEFVSQRIRTTEAKSFHVGWYGGEPLLELNRIRSLSKSFLTLAAKENITYGAGIITNGTLLTAEAAQILREEGKVSTAQITIDGLPATHNKRRILRDGSESFDTIIENIDAVRKIISISVRVNVDRSNADEAKALIEYFINDRHWEEDVIFYFSPVHKSTEYCQIKENTCFSSSEFGPVNAELFNHTYKLGNRRVPLQFYPRVIQSYCSGPSVNSLVMDPEGNFCKCWEHIGDPRHFIGSLSSGLVMNEEHSRWLNYRLDSKCFACKILPICQGGCPAERVSGNITNDCPYNIASFRDLVLLRYKDHEKQNEITTA